MRTFEGRIPPDLDIGMDEEFLFLSRDQSRYTHGIHSHPAKFFPELPRYLIEAYSRPGQFILDPFMGSGTTNVEALILRRPSAGLEINPFARMMARVKTIPLDSAVLMSQARALLRRVGQFHPSDKSSKLPDFPGRDHWFPHYSAHELAYLRDCILEEIPEGPYQNFFLVTLASVIRPASRATNGDPRTFILRKERKIIEPGMTLDLFGRRVWDNLWGMQELTDCEPGLTFADIPDNGDALNIPYKRVFDLVVTSPPYVNAMDFLRGHQLEINWLGLGVGSLVEMKPRLVGTETISIDEYSLPASTGLPAADAVIERIYQDKKLLAGVAARYLRDMRTALRGMHQALTASGVLAMVIGSNRLAGHDFPTWEFCQDIALEEGFVLEKRFYSAIIRHGSKLNKRHRIPCDSIMVFRKRGGVRVS